MPLHILTGMGKVMLKNHHQRNIKEMGLILVKKHPILMSSTPCSTFLKPDFLNIPLSNLELTKWISYLKILNIIGVTSRNRILHHTWSLHYKP